MVAWLLRAGVLLSAAVVLGGGICYVAQYANQVPQVAKFHGEPPQYRGLRGIVRAVMTGDCSAVIQFGLIMLIATPVLRVALSFVGFAGERDRTYVIVTAIVLGVLAFSLTGKI